MAHHNIRPAKWIPPFSIIDNEIIEKEFEITPTVKTLRGALRKTNSDEMDYKNYLEEKYL